MIGFLISNSYTTVCPPVRGDTPRALASKKYFVLKFAVSVKGGVTSYTLVFLIKI